MTLSRGAGTVAARKIGSDRQRAAAGTAFSAARGGQPDAVTPLATAIARLHGGQSLSDIKVSVVVRSFGHGTTEVWLLMPWERFLHVVRAAGNYVAAQSLLAPDGDGRW